MKRILNLSMLLMLALAFSACAGGKMSGTTEARDSKDKPDWALTPPAADGMIYGVGQAKKQNPSLAKKVAAQRARDEIAGAVKVKVESSVKDFMQESGIGENAQALEFTQNVSQGITEATLTGALIKEAFTAKDGTYFVLMEYSLDEARRAAIESARQEEALYNEFKAEQGFDALEEKLKSMR